jgi:DeoR/GlpR family transcriptional regulator of sugar metabolism
MRNTVRHSDETQSAGPPSDGRSSRRSPIARRTLLRRELVARGAVSVAELSEVLGASSATIRRDLDALAREGFVVRSHGGAAARTLHPAEEAFAVRERKDVPEKVAVARAVAGLIRSGQTIFLNDGSTAAMLARELATADIELFVVATAVNVAHVLADNPRFSVCLLGGFVRRTSLATSGPFAEAMLDRFNADLAIISSDGFSVEEGMSYSNADDAHLALKMAARARQCIAMLTSSKFGKNSRMSGVPTAEIDTIVTDAIPFQMKVALDGAGVEVIEARVEEAKPK